MASHKYVDLDLPEAQTLSGLTGIVFDLETARDFATRLASAMAESNPDFILLDALMSAALVRYARAFTTGSRISLQNETLAAAYDDRQRLYHDKLRALRNKYIAHSDSHLESTLSRAYYVEERVADEGFTSIACQHLRLVGLSHDDVNNIIELCERMLDHVRRCIDEEKKQVLRIVRSRPIETFLTPKQSPTK